MKVIRPVDFKLFLFENNDMNMSLRGKCRFSLVSVTLATEEGGEMMVRWWCLLSGGGDSGEA